jgi:hypothetical protein
MRPIPAATPGHAPRLENAGPDVERATSTPTSSPVTFIPFESVTDTEIWYEPGDLGVHVNREEFSLGQPAGRPSQE